MFVIKNIFEIFLEKIIEFGPAIVFIIITAIIARIILSKLIERAVRRMVGATAQDMSDSAEEKRENTLIKILDGASRVLIWLVAVMMILSEIGIEIGPILAAAGIAGVAIGFGGQYLIKDLISGFFIIIENQYRIDDVVCLGDTCGLVEDITLRVTTLRDLNGTVHHVPHGEVTKVSNLSKGFARVNLNIGVAYDTDIEKVEKIINKIGEDMAADPEWGKKIKSAPKFIRIDDFGDSAISIKILGDTKPIEQWAVTGELRKRIKIAFDKEGIVIPFPQVTVSELIPKK